MSRKVLRLEIDEQFHDVTDGESVATILRDYANNVDGEDLTEAYLSSNGTRLELTDDSKAQRLARLGEVAVALYARLALEQALAPGSRFPGKALVESLREALVAAGFRDDVEKYDGNIRSIALKSRAIERRIENARKGNHA